MLFVLYSKSVFICVFWFHYKGVKIAHYLNLLLMFFSKFRNVCIRYDPGGHLLLLGRPSFVLFVVILMLNVDCLVIKIEWKCTHVSIFVVCFQFWVNIFMSFFVLFCPSLLLFIRPPFSYNSLHNVLCVLWVSIDYNDIILYYYWAYTTYGMRAPPRHHRCGVWGSGGSDKVVFHFVFIYVPVVR